MQKVPNNTVTRNLVDFSAETGNIYESVVAISKRADQISTATMNELQKKLHEFTNTSSDNLEETFENREQIDISIHYEQMPKPTIVATEEFLQGELNITNIK